MNKQSALYQGVRKKYFYIKNTPKRLKKAVDTQSLKHYRNLYAGETCFVIGNGPSLRISDLDMIHKLKIKSFACNRVFLAFTETDWRPSFYIASDSKIVSETSIDKIQIPYDNMFFPRKFKQILKKGNYYETLQHDWLNDDKFSTDVYCGVYGRETVIIDALQLAYYMGFTNVYIIGVDFSYNMKNVDKEKLTFENGENNYFIKNYSPKGEVLNLPNQEANILGFKAARKAFELDNREIYNATRGGQLEVFIRKDLDQVFKELEEK